LRLAKKARELSRIMGFEVRPRVFPSLCDPFEDRIDLLPWRAEFFELIEKTPELDWLLLTKRPENVLGMVPHMSWYGTNDFARTHCRFPSNLWLGTSVENQEAADKRIPHLLEVPAKVRFLSCEPLLGPIDFVLAKENQDTLFGSQVVGANVLAGRVETRFQNGAVYLDQAVDERRVHWVIVGGESGSDARPMHPDWVRGIRDQCVTAGVPYLFKQWGRHAPDENGKLWRHSSKHHAGRILDGRTWDEQPKVSR